MSSSSPIGPSANQPPPHLPSAPAPSPQPAQTTSWEDPTGVWQRFLSKGGAPATSRDVEMFIGTLTKFFSNVIFQQSNAAAKRAAQRLKDTIKGDSD